MANIKADANNVKLKIIESNNVSRKIKDATPEITQIDIRTNETTAKVLRGLIYPRKDGNVLYSIPKIMSNGKNSHNRI